MRELDLWRCAIVRKRVGDIGPDDLIGDKLVWLPAGRPHSFRADPFGLWNGGALHIFVEYFDYRDLKGVIELLVYDEKLRFVRSRVVLDRPWHLSYPQVFQADGETWMLPEARKSGALTLYRARAFPDDWEAAGTIAISPDAVDATPLFHGGRWWLFSGHGGRRHPEGMKLNIFFADRLTGPWQAHPLNPVRRGPAGTRPAGTPIVRSDGSIDLPVQDSSATYGGAVRRLSIRRLDGSRFEAEIHDWLAPSAALAPYVDGLHTLSKAGDVCLIDCKRVDRSWRGNLAWRRGRISERLRRPR